MSAKRKAMASPCGPTKASTFIIGFPARPSTDSLEKAGYLNQTRETWRARCAEIAILGGAIEGVFDVAFRDEITA